MRGTTAAPGEGLIHLDGVTLRDVDFRKATFAAVAPFGCAFEHCDFRDTLFDRRLLPLFTAQPRSTFRDCRFDGADLRRAPPGQSRFERCSFEAARLDEWVVSVAEFVDCRFAGTLSGVVFHRWSDLAARGQALDLLQAASFLYREQSEVIARRVEERSPIAAEVQRRLWETLATVL